MKRKRRSRTPKIETVGVGNVMVKIYRRARPTANGKTRPVFEVADYTTWRRRLRGFTDLEAARQEAARMARRLASGQLEGASMRSSDTASYGRALEILRPLGVSLEIAVSTYARAVEILHGDRLIEAANFYARHGAANIQPRRVADVVQELIATKNARGQSASYLSDLCHRLNKFAEKSAVDVHTVTTADVQRFLDGLKLSPQSVKNYRRVLQTLFSFAEARGYLPKNCNPVADTERVKVNGGRIEVYSPDEFKALLQAAAPDFLPVVALGGLAGLRTAEIQRLEWSDVRLADHFIVVGADKAKTATRRVVPICDSLAAWLAPYANKTGKVCKGDALDLRLARTATAKRAGVEWKPNALRHSFASYSFALCNDAGRVAGFCGNSAAVIHKHYRELVRPADGQAFFSITPERAANVLSMPGSDCLKSDTAKAPALKEATT